LLHALPQRAHLARGKPHLRHAQQPAAEAMKPAHVLPADSMDEVGAGKAGVELRPGVARRLIALERGACHT
jgi:hypothetical protein